MKSLEKIMLGIFVFSLVAGIIFLILALQSGITGKVVRDISDTEGDTEKVTSDVASIENKGEIICSDSDGGKNYGLKGEVYYCDLNGKCSTRYDSCSEKILTEWYCRDKERRYIEYECGFECKDSICKEISTSGGGGSGGGGATGSGSGGSSVGSGQTYNLGELSSEQTVDAAINDNIAFSLGENSYTITIAELSPVQATFSASNGNTFSLVVGNQGTLDLNSDGNADAYLKLKTINIITNKAKVSLNLA